MTLKALWPTVAFSAILKDKVRRTNNRLIRFGDPKLSSIVVIALRVSSNEGIPNRTDGMKTAIDLGKEPAKTNPLFKEAAGGLSLSRYTLDIWAVYNPANVSAGFLL